jgi:integrase
MANGWFRRRKGKLVYFWKIEAPATGKMMERSRVVGPESMSDEEGWQKVGVLKQNGEINTQVDQPSLRNTFREVAAHYLANKEWKKLSTKDLHTQIIKVLLVPRWGAEVAAGIKPQSIRSWLRSLDVEEPTQYKYKTVMGGVYRFAQAEGLLPLGEQYNPVRYVTGISSTSDYEAAVFTPEQTLRVLELLPQPVYTLLVLIAATGLRISEALGLKWSAVLWDRSQIRIRETYVHGNMQEGAKTRLSKSKVAMHAILAELLKEWRGETMYAEDDDFVFASEKLGGEKPRSGSMLVEDYLKPAAINAGIIKVENGKTYDEDGELVKRFGFHSFRHSLTSWLMANGENPQVVRAMLRWTSLNMLWHYTHGFSEDKLEAQGAVLEKIVPQRVRQRVLAEGA